MTKVDWLAIVIIAVLVMISVYAAVVFSQNQTNLWFGITLLWAILPPILFGFPQSFKYILILPSPVLGTWFLLIFALLRFGQISGYSIIGMAVLSFAIVLIFHYLTRMRAMFWRIPMASVSRTSVAIVSIFFIYFGVMLVTPTPFPMGDTSLIFYFVVTLIAYIATSMLFLNSSYRVFTLSKRVKTDNLEKTLEKTWANIEMKYSGQIDDCSLLQFYFYSSYRAFIDGDYEKSLIWGCKVIREQTVVDPTALVDDARIGKPSFSEIRNTLEHSRRKGHVKEEDIRKIFRELPDDCLDLVEREISLLGKIEGI
jgi:hypothetical protein